MQFNKYLTNSGLASNEEAIVLIRICENWNLTTLSAHAS